MEKETIEARDREFCDKLCELRRDLVNRQELSANKKGNSRNPFKIAAPILIILLAAYFSVGKTTPSRQPEPTATRAQEIPSSTDNSHVKSPGSSEKPTAEPVESEAAQETNLAASPPSSAGSPSSRAEPTATWAQEMPSSTDNSHVKSPGSENPTAEPVESETAQETNLAASPPSSTGSPSSRAEPTATQTHEIPSSTDNSHVKSPGSSENPTAEPVESEAAQETNPAASPPSSAGTPSAYNAKIVRKSICSEIKDRECVTPLSRFSLDDQIRPYFWMEVYSDSVPYTLKHVYYHEGRKYTEVPLEIRCPRMRTWSKITFSDPVQLGSWRVQIETENGVVLGSDEFRIVEGRQPDHPDLAR